MYYVLVFVFWTFIIYWTHRLVHILPYFKHIHADHHKQISQNTFQGLNWKNLFLYFDSPKSTLDQWYTEVIPTILMSFIFGWWLFVVYYIWAAFIQEAVISVHFLTVQASFARAINNQLQSIQFSQSPHRSCPLARHRLIFPCLPTSQPFP